MAFEDKTESSSNKAQHARFLRSRKGIMTSDPSPFGAQLGVIMMAIISAFFLAIFLGVRAGFYHETKDFLSNTWLSPCGPSPQMGGALYWKQGTFSAS